MTAVEQYPPISDLVPHGPPIRALERMLEWEPGRALCEMTLRPHSPFLSGDTAPTVVTLELMAQGVAACLGYEAYQGGDGVRVGMIVGVRKMDVFQPFLQVGQHLQIDVQRLRGTEDVSTFQGRTWLVGPAAPERELIAEAMMTLVHPEQPPEGL